MSLHVRKVQITEQLCVLIDSEEFQFQFRFECPQQRFDCG